MLFSILTMITLKAKSMKYSETKQFMARNGQNRYYHSSNNESRLVRGILSYTVAILVAGNVVTSKEQT